MRISADFKCSPCPTAGNGGSTMFDSLAQGSRHARRDGKSDHSENLGKWTDRAWPRRWLIFHLPKFKVNVSLDLNDMLKALGMTLAFDPRRADFTRIDSQEKLFLSESDASSVCRGQRRGDRSRGRDPVDRRCLGRPQPEKPIEFRADHPFVFLIRDNLTQTFFFLGRLVNPSPR